MQTRHNEHSSGQVPYLFPDMYMARVEVVFGTPSKHCAGNGICMMTSSPLIRTPIHCPHTPARIRRVPGEGLVILFAKKYINTDALLAYFVNPKFLVEEAFALPRRLAKDWCLPSPWIAPGCYDLETYHLEWRLYIPLPNIEVCHITHSKPDRQSTNLPTHSGPQLLPAEALGPLGFKDRLSQ